MSRHQTASAAGAALCIAVVLACDDAGQSTAPEPIAQAAQTLLLVDGDGQVGEAGNTLAKPLQVRVIDAQQHPVAGVQIAWKAITSGTFDAATSLTDSAGVARVTLTLWSIAGPQQATATIASDTSQRVTFRFTTLVQGAMQMVAERANPERDTVLTTRAPYRVTVRDHTNAPVAGVEVRWQVYGGSGTLSNEFSRTDVNGVAHTTHRVGTEAVTEEVLAFVPGLLGSPAVFRAVVMPGALVGATGSGDGQIDLLGARLGTPYRITLRDAYGNEVRAIVGVDWRVVSGSGSVTAEGLSAARHTLGPIDGLQLVTATVRSPENIPPVPFTSRAVTAMVSATSGYYCYDLPNFAPASIEVSSGRTVAFMLTDYCYTQANAHNIVFEDDPTTTASSGTHVRTFTGPPGVIRYRCTKHSTSFTEGMVGTITIR